MTCHVAFSSPDGAVLVCDSQTSTDRAEAHGFQKLYAGPDFLLGGAGYVPLIDAVFGHLDGIDPPVGFGSVSAEVERFIRDEVAPSSQQQVQFVLVGPTSPGAIWEYSPQLFTSFRRSGDFASIGSGSEFVVGALRSYRDQGTLQHSVSMAQMLHHALCLLVVAGESLTVDDRLLVGMLRRGRSYLIGDSTVQLSRCPPQVLQRWQHAAALFRQLRSQSTSIWSERRHAEGILSRWVTGPLSDADMDEVRAAETNAFLTLQLIGAALDSYFAWYDQQLGRVTAPPAVP